MLDLKLSKAPAIFSNTAAGEGTRLLSRVAVVEGEDEDAQGVLPRVLTATSALGGRPVEGRRRKSWVSWGAACAA